MSEKPNLDANSIALRTAKASAIQRLETFRRVLLSIPEDWLCEECGLSKAIVPDYVIAEDLSMFSTSINSESVCTSPVLKPSRKPADHENEMVLKSNTRFLENEKILGPASKKGNSRVVSVKKSSVPSKSEHLARNSVSSFEQSNAMATASKSSPTHDHRILRHCRSKFGSTTL